MAYNFNGSSQRLSTASTPVTAVPLTLACWFNPDRISANEVLLTVINASTGDRFALLPLGNVAGDPLRANVLAGGSQVSADSTIGFSASSWQHAAGVFTSNASRTVYLNGGNSATNTIPWPAPSGVDAIRVASRPSGGVEGLFFDGQIAEVGIWNAALTQPEIASLAKGMTCDKVRPQSLVLYAPLVRDLQDVKGGLTITNNNTATVANHPRVYA
jgi:hypothetical protein